jgi:hypothetical protein
MTLSTRPAKKPFSFSNSLHHQLNLYAVAAGAAGVGMLALAQPVEAKIIYTKADERVFGIAVPLDLNHDGTTDFYFFSLVVATTPATTVGLLLHPDSPGNAVWVTRKWKAAALRAGAEIGPKAPFSSHNSDVAMGAIVIDQTNGKRYYYGPWENGGKGVKNRYLGLRFQIKGKTHYGWARLNFPSPQLAKLTGYAYETIPNKPIIAGETKGTDESNVEQPNAVLISPIPDIPQLATLGALARGAPGLSIWRREDSVAATPERN